MKLNSVFFYMVERCQILISQIWWKVLKFRINKIYKQEKVWEKCTEKSYFWKYWKIICINIGNTKIWQYNSFEVVRLIFSNYPKCSNFTILPTVGLRFLEFCAHVLLIFWSLEIVFIFYVSLYLIKCFSYICLLSLLLLSVLVKFQLERFFR